METFFNYSFEEARGRWDRRTFARRWYRLCGDDRRWSPPYAPDFRRFLNPGAGHGLDVVALTASAVRRRGGETEWPGNLLPGGMVDEGVVAMAVVAASPEQRGSPARLVDLQLANSGDVVERLVDALSAVVEAGGRPGLVGPAGHYPWLGAGLLESGWDRLSPFYAPYHPPYLAELAGAGMERLAGGRLWSLDPAGGEAARKLPGLEISPFPPSLLAGELLPLFEAACPEWPGLPTPARAEAAFLLESVARWPLEGLLARLEGRPAGFVLLGPDLADRLRSARGGWSLFRRGWLLWSARRPAAEGRLLLGGVLPDLRGSGIGTALLVHAKELARLLGWKRLSTGPLPDGSPGAEFLARRGAVSHQEYGWYGFGEVEPEPAYF